MLVFIFIIFVKSTRSESISDDQVIAVMEDDRGSQPSNQRTPIESNEAEGKRVRRVLTKYFDP